MKTEHQVGEEQARAGSRDSEVAAHHQPVVGYEVKVGGAEHETGYKARRRQGEAAPHKMHCEEEDEHLLKNYLERLGKEVCHIEAQKKHVRIEDDERLRGRDEKREQ